MSVRRSRIVRALAFALLLPAAVATLPSGLAHAAAPTIENPIIVTSSDGTPIVATLMLPAGASASNQVPAILRTHGWGGSRETTASGLVSRLLTNGYAVLTWDSRGFGESGGEAQVGAPGYEVEDAKALISYLASRPEIQKDGPGDPRVGWTGGSNAGGVQFNTAALDHRVDAIVPEISWGNLNRSLMPNGIAKRSWDALLYGAGLAGAGPGGLQSPAGVQLGTYAAQIHESFAEIVSTGTIDPALNDWFAFRSTTVRSSLITAPTLIIQGTMDTLFPLEEGFDNYRNLTAAGTPVKLIAYCAGHSLTGCQYPGGSSGYPEGAGGKPAIYEDRIMAWLDHYVKHLPVSTGPRIEWEAQDGHYYGASSFPLPGTTSVAGTAFSTTLVGPGRTGGDQPASGVPAKKEPVTSYRQTVLAWSGSVRSIFGVPKVRITGSLIGKRGAVYLELVDVAPDGSLVTVDDQTMPVLLKPGAVDATFDLHGIAWRLQPGHELALEVSTGSTQYDITRRGPYVIGAKFAASFPVA